MMKNYKCYTYYLGNDNTAYDYRFISGYFSVNPETATAKCIQNIRTFKAEQLYNVIITEKGYVIVG